MAVKKIISVLFPRHVENKTESLFDTFLVSNSSVILHHICWKSSLKRGKDLNFEKISNPNFHKFFSEKEREKSSP